MADLAETAIDVPTMPEAGRRRRAVRLSALAASAFAALVAVVLFADRWPGWVRANGGDVLVVLPVYAIVAIVRPRWHPSTIAVGTFALAVCVELSQLYHASTIDAFRATFVGRMTIGNAFSVADIGCYFAGTCLAFCYDAAWAWRAH